MHRCTGAPTCSWVLARRGDYPQIISRRHGFHHCGDRQRMRTSHRLIPALCSCYAPRLSFEVVSFKTSLYILEWVQASILFIISAHPKSTQQVQLSILQTLKLSNKGKGNSQLRWTCHTRSISSSCSLPFWQCDIRSPLSSKSIVPTLPPPPEDTSLAICPPDLPTFTLPRPSPLTRPLVEVLPPSFPLNPVEIHSPYLKSPSLPS